MTAIEIFCKLVKESEGCVLTAYPDPGSGSTPWTIGWGSTGAGITKGTKWTQAQADKRLYEDLEKILGRALSLSPSLRNQSPSRQAAIADFIYNCGEGNYMKSTLKRRVDSGDFVGAQSEIIKWNKASGKVLRGLVIRRSKEAELLK